MKIGHSAIAGVTATDLGIEQRSPRQASNVTVEALERVHERYTQFSLCLQAEFGLKRQESIKFRAAEAGKGNGFIVLHASWVLGGRSWTIGLEILPLRVGAAPVYRREKPLKIVICPRAAGLKPIPCSGGRDF